MPRISGTCRLTTDTGFGIAGKASLQLYVIFGGGSKAVWLIPLISNPFNNVCFFLLALTVLSPVFFMQKKEAITAPPI